MTQLVPCEEEAGNKIKSSEENKGDTSVQALVTGPTECGYCCVFYGDNPEYLLLLLVLAHRLTVLGSKHPLLVLPTTDVPEKALAALRQAGCVTLPPVAYLPGHPSLFQNPNGRHRHVFTKLRVLGLSSFKKVLLIDADVLPRQNLDPLFEYEPPAAMLMPAHLEWVSPLKAGSPIPVDWLGVNTKGRAARINCGVCLLSPDPALLLEIEKEIDPSRNFNVAGGVVHSIFGQAWRPSWTPEEDMLTRALVARGATWTHIGCAFNFEVVNDAEYYSGLPIAIEHANLDFVHDAAAFHFSGSSKPSWYAWFVGLGLRSTAEVHQELQEEESSTKDARKICATAVVEWLSAFEELAAHAVAAWGLDVLAVCGWREERRTKRKQEVKQAVPVPEPVPCDCGASSPMVPVG